MKGLSPNKILSKFSVIYDNTHGTPMLLSNLTQLQRTLRSSVVFPSISLASWGCSLVLRLGKIKYLNTKSSVY